MKTTDLSLLNLRLIDILTHKPFECLSVYVYSMRNGKPVASNDTSETLLAENSKLIELLATSDSSSHPIWFKDIQTNQYTTRTRLCFGGCRVASVVVIVSKSFDSADTGYPIDDYFIDALTVRVAVALGIDPTITNSIPVDSIVNPVTGIRADLNALDIHEAAWREVYGPDVWLAVKEGTVIAYGEKRGDVELQIITDKIPSPVLYVPPSLKNRTLEVFSLHY